MKKFMNDVDAILSDSLAGFAAAHANLVTLGPGNKFVRRAQSHAGQGCFDFRRR